MEEVEVETARVCPAAADIHLDRSRVHFLYTLISYHASVVNVAIKKNLSMTNCA
jgi:hypothetical protein